MPDPSMPISDLRQELVALGVPEADAKSFEDNLARQDVTSAGQLCKMNIRDFNASTGSLLTMHIHTLLMCLGSAGAPHVFAPAPETEREEAQSASEDPHAIVVSTAQGSKPPKGGSLHAVAEVLSDRRPYMYPASYYPPPAFDKYQFDPTIPPSAPKWPLRVAIVQEIEAVVGDLYPSSNEREVILGAIEHYVGPPGLGHYNSWMDNNHKKHKGTAISDLEKARRNPAAYGVSGRCVPNRMRPARPQRAKAPESALLVTGMGQHLRGSISGPISRGPTPNSTQEPSLEPSPEEVHDLDSDAALHKQVRELQQQLNALQDQQQAAKLSKQTARKAANENNDKQKPKTGKQNPKPAAKARGLPTAKGLAQPAAKGLAQPVAKGARKPAAKATAGLSAYEIKRLENMQANEAALKALRIKDHLIPPAKKLKVAKVNSLAQLAQLAQFAVG